MSSTRSKPVRYRNLVMDSARWEGFEFRPDDIVISTPPKCGTTWMQVIVALLVFQAELERPLDEVSVWLDMQTRPVGEVFARLQAQTHRRFIKTHTPLDGLPYDERVTYICVGRDPRDVALSWDNHLANMDIDAFFAVRARAVGNGDLAELMPDGPPPPPPPRAADRFWAWMDAPAATGFGSPSLANTVHHLATFWEVRDRPNVLLAHYDGLSADLAGQMRRIADRLGIDVPEERWPALVAAAGFERMRSRADRLAPESSWALWRENGRFFNRGTSGQWHEIVDAEGARRYRARVAELGDPDLLAWIHQEA